MMNYLFSIVLLTATINMEAIFDFNNEADISAWKVLDDVVMGGQSTGSFKLTAEGFGLFHGKVSLENNGGFSSVRYRFSEIKVPDTASVRIKLKGDGKKYQFRVKNNSETAHSYINYFQTSGDWQEVEIPLKELFPSYRGRKPDLPNFSQNQIEEVGFLIANERNEEFRLLIDLIELISPLNQ